MGHHAVSTNAKAVHIPSRKIRVKNPHTAAMAQNSAHLAARSRRVLCLRLIRLL